MTQHDFRLVTVASGAASGKLLEYEVGGPRVCVQTAYGVEVEVIIVVCYTNIFSNIRSCFQMFEQILHLLDLRETLVNCSSSLAFQDVSFFLFKTAIKNQLCKIFKQLTCSTPCW